MDPADRVASAKVTADGIQTWSVSELDKKGKKKKGTLGIGNGALFFASEADKVCIALHEFGINLHGHADPSTEMENHGRSKCYQ